MPVVTSKVSEEIYSAIKDLAKEQGSDVSSVIREALPAILNGEMKPTDTRPFQEKINVLELENQNLKNQLSELSDQIAAIKYRESELETLNQRLTEINQETASRFSEAIIYTDQEMKILKLVTDNVNQKTGKILSPGEMLFRLFYNQLTRGAGDWLPIIIHKSKLQ